MYRFHSDSGLRSDYTSLDGPCRFDSDAILAEAPIYNTQQTELAIAARELLDYLDGNAEHGESQEVLVENLRDALQKQASR